MHDSLKRGRTFAAALLLGASLTACGKGDTAGDTAGATGMGMADTMTPATGAAPATGTGMGPTMGATAGATGMGMDTTRRDTTRRP